MNKHGQTNVSGIGMTPEHGRDMDFLVQMDIISLELKDRPWHLPTTNEPEPVEEEFSGGGIK